MYSGCVPQTGCKASDLHQFCCPLWWGWAGGGDGGKLAQPELSPQGSPTRGQPLASLFCPETRCLSQSGHGLTREHGSPS